VKRRRFLLASAAFAVPASALAQRKPARIGFLSAINPEPYLGFFREALRKLGYAEGKTLVVDFRSAEGKADALVRLAAELVGAKPDVIVGYQTPAIAAAKKATGSIPIVMAPAGDPVATGFVKTLARPGGNITGMAGNTPLLAAKTLEFLRDIRPQTARLAVLASEPDPFTKPLLEALGSAGKKLGIELNVAMVRRTDDFGAAFERWSREKLDAVFVQPSLPRKLAIELAARHRMLSISAARAFAEAGGLISYASSPKEIAEKAAAFVDRILKGANPAELPVEQPTVFEVVVNLKTAKALGITFPAPIIARADAVIE
jgi:putative ABC transport system substrate-binding protein